MNSAKQYYDGFYNISPPMLGPYLDPTKISKKHIRSLKKLHTQYWKKIIEDINSCKNSFRDNEIFVPSPWHAWALLKVAHSDLTNLEEPVPYIVGNYPSPVYRGQSNANFLPIPSLLRSDTDRHFENKCLEAFSFIFNQDFLWQQFGITPSKNSAKAAAQHYGIKTNLLDITADPAVAVYFASRSKIRSYGDRAAVFIFDLQHFMPESFNLILPPPFVERLYIQRASFLCYSESNKFQSNIQRLFFKITFPFNSNFNIYDASTKNNLLPQNDWFSKLAKWSKEWTSVGNRIPKKLSDQNNLSMNIFEQSIGYPNFYDNGAFIPLINLIEKFDDMLYWYAIRINKNSEYILSGICKEIANSNPEIITFMNKLREQEISFLENNKSPTSLIETKKNIQKIWGNL